LLVEIRDAPNRLLVAASLTSPTAQLGAVEICRRLVSVAAADNLEGGMVDKVDVLGGGCDLDRTVIFFVTFLAAGDSLLPVATPLPIVRWFSWLILLLLLLLLLLARLVPCLAADATVAAINRLIIPRDSCLAELEAGFT
jgi:hypothetical protein